MKNEYIDICEIFFTMENELNLFSWKTDNIYVWELIRFNIFYLIIQKRGLYGQAHTTIKKNLWNYLKILFLSIRNFIIKNPFLIPRGNKIFIGHPRRKLLDDGTYWDIYCDPIIESVFPEAYLLENRYLNHHLQPARTKKIYYLDIIDLFAYAYKTLTRIFPKNDTQYTDFAEKLKQEIIIRFGVDININQHYKKALLTFTAHKKIYKILLKTIQPEILFLLVGYGKEALIAAAKELFIPTVEIQHGTISRYHMAYSFPNGNSKHFFSDYFFTFGNFWKSVAKFPIDHNRIKTFGYPYLSHSLKKYTNNTKKNLIVFISQGSIGKELSKFALKLRKIIPPHIEIIYKLHPGEYDRWKKEYPWLQNNNISIIDSQHPDLYTLLSSALCQIGVYSTAIYEGLAFGCQTFLVDLPGIANMDQLDLPAKNKNVAHCKRRDLSV
jgi:hypothetical protein